MAGAELGQGSGSSQHETSILFVFEHAHEVSTTVHVIAEQSFYSFLCREGGSVKRPGEGGSGFYGSGIQWWSRTPQFRDKCCARAEGGFLIARFDRGQPTRRG